VDAAGGARLEGEAGGGLRDERVEALGRHGPEDSTRLRLEFLPGVTEMILFRVFLAFVFVTLAGYTGVVISSHGIDLLPVFFGDMAKLAWPGQFNLDFLCLLTLSGLWVAHRHRFRATGLLLGVCAFFGGALFLSLYLLVESFRVEGSVAALLLGEHREAA